VILFLTVTVAAGTALLTSGKSAHFQMLEVIFSISALGVVIGYAGLWRVLEKAGRPGWHAFWRTRDVIDMIGWSSQDFWFFSAPVAWIYTLFGSSIHLAAAYGKGRSFGLGLFLLPPLFYPILGFGCARYLGPDEVRTERIA
jgi:hypothetical protein